MATNYLITHLSSENRKQIAGHLFLRDLESLRATCKECREVFAPYLGPETAKFENFRKLFDGRPRDRIAPLRWLKAAIHSPEAAKYVQEVDLMTPWSDSDDYSAPEWETMEFMTASDMKMLGESQPATLKWISPQNTSWQNIAAGPNTATDPRCRFWDIFTLLLPMWSDLRCLKLYCSDNMYGKDFREQVMLHMDLPSVLTNLANTACEMLKDLTKGPRPLPYLRRLQLCSAVPSVIYGLMALPTVEIVELSEMHWIGRPGSLLTYPRKTLPQSRAKAVLIEESLVPVKELQYLLSGLQGPCVVLHAPKKRVPAQNLGKRHNWRSVLIPFESATVFETFTVRRDWTKREALLHDEYNQLSHPWKRFALAPQPEFHRYVDTFLELLYMASDPADNMMLEYVDVSEDGREVNMDEETDEDLSDECSSDEESQEEYSRDQNSQDQDSRDEAMDAEDAAATEDVVMRADE